MLRDCFSLSCNENRQFHAQHTEYLLLYVGIGMCVPVHTLIRNGNNRFKITRGLSLTWYGYYSVAKNSFNSVILCTNHHHNLMCKLKQKNKIRTHRTCVCARERRRRKNCSSSKMYLKTDRRKRVRVNDEKENSCITINCSLFAGCVCVRNLVRGKWAHKCKMVANNMMSILQSKPISNKKKLHVFSMSV